MLFTIQIGVRQTILVYHKILFDEQGGGGRDGIVFLNERNFWEWTKFFLKKDIVKKKQTVDERNGLFREMIVFL